MSESSSSRKGSNSVLVDPNSPPKRMLGYAVEPIPNRITPDIIIVYDLLYDRLRELIKRGAISKRHIDFSFSYLELTQILAANSQYDYTIKPKTKAAYVADMEQFIFSGVGIITPQELKAKADVQSLESADSDDAEMHPEWFYSNGKRKPADVIDEETYLSHVRKIHEMYSKSHGRLTLESMSAMSKFTESDFADILRHNGDISHVGANGKNKSKQSMAAEIHKMIVDKKLKLWGKAKEEEDREKRKERMKEKAKEKTKSDSSEDDNDEASSEGKPSRASRGRGRGGRGRGRGGRRKSTATSSNKSDGSATESDEAEPADDEEEEEESKTSRRGLNKSVQRAKAPSQPSVPPPPRSKASSSSTPPPPTQPRGGRKRSQPEPSEEKSEPTPNGESHPPPSNSHTTLKKQKSSESSPSPSTSSPSPPPPSVSRTLPKPEESFPTHASFTPADSSRPFSSPIQRTFPSSIIPQSSASLAQIALGNAPMPQGAVPEVSHPVLSAPSPPPQNSNGLPLPSSAQSNPQSEEKSKVKLQVSGSGFNKYFLVPESKKFRFLVSKLETSIPAIAEKKSKIRLIYNGKTLQENDTPISMGMGSDSVITVEII